MRFIDLLAAKKNGMARLLTIDVWPDYVTIEGTTVKRPVHISRSLWMTYWEHHRLL